MSKKIYTSRMSGMKPRVRSSCILITIVLVIMAVVILGLFFIFPRLNSTPLNPRPNEITKPDISHSWVYVTNNLKFTATPAGDASGCTVDWLNDTAVDMTLYTFDAAGTRRNLITSINDSTCSIAENISTLGYVGITINGEDSGGLEPPAVTAGAEGMMHLMFALPDNPTTVYPTSGIWHYTMTANENNLDCSVGSFATTADGQVTFITTNYGLSGTLNAEDSTIFFSRSAYANPYYESPDYSFPINDTYGSVLFSFNVTDQEHMTGSLHMEGDVCSGDYPLTMELITPTVPPIYVPHQGSWNMQAGPLVCGGNVLTPGALTGLPIGFASLSITGGGPIPMQLDFSGTSSNLRVLQSVDTNIYSSLPYLYLGTATDPITHLPYNVMGTWNLNVLSETQIIATLTMLGTNGCTGATVVQLQQF